MILHDSNSFRKGREAEPTYDIFKRRDGDYPFWITAAASLEEAKERIAWVRSHCAGGILYLLAGEGIILECVVLEKGHLQASRPIWLWSQSWNQARHGKVA